MHLSLELVMIVLLVPSVIAIPQYSVEIDQCKKTVFAGPSRLPPHVSRTAAAKSDCDSYLKKTLSPCPVYEIAAFCGLRDSDKRKHENDNQDRRKDSQTGYENQYENVYEVCDIDQGSLEDAGPDSIFNSQADSS
ncbi:hypothetical protein N0V90_004265 [Kalmusia sp. IMI 367209]|nr:hypothetical protein N0V90_004265 [Kalmusia sp. IMI 367209]